MPGVCCFRFGGDEYLYQLQEARVPAETIDEAIDTLTEACHTWLPYVCARCERTQLYDVKRHFKHYASNKKKPRNV